jgi:hypothetical protein
MLDFRIPGILEFWTDRNLAAADGLLYTVHYRVQVQSTYIHPVHTITVSVVTFNELVQDFIKQNDECNI